MKIGVHRCRSSVRSNAARYRSSFADWNRFGQWFWNLVRKQFESSDALKAKVAELTEGKKEPLDKIRAIYRFVVRDIHYQAETSFNIHGWKPYKASTVLERKNGDCKDKAILFATMMREAGLKAYVALTYLEGGGRGRPDLTLPLIQHFNHAIAYVPPDDGREEMWLDLTATEYSFEDQPPEWDRGAYSLVVGPDMAELKRIPLRSPLEPVQQFDVDVEVDEKGGATLDIHVTASAGLAWMVRQRMEAEGRRKERLENALSDHLAGCKVVDIEMPDLKDTSVNPVKWSAKAKVCLLYTSPSPRDLSTSRMPSSA